MKALIRMTALLLSLMLLAACSPAGNTEDTTAADTTAEAVDTTTAEETLDPTLRANHFDSIPETVTFNGATVTCIFDCTEEAISGIPQLYIFNDLLGTDNSGDVLADAVWVRNQNTQDRLNIKLAWKPTGSSSYNENRPIFQQLLMAQDNSFDFILSTGSSLAYVGGGQYMLIGNLIETQFISVGDWNFGSAISLILAAVILIFMTLMKRMDRTEQTEE